MKHTTLPVGHGLDEHWPVLINCHVSGMFSDLMHSQYIVAIHSNGLHTIPLASPGNAIASILLLHRGGDGIGIVTAAGRAQAVSTTSLGASESYWLTRRI